jgi:hypothetical protein
VKRSRRSEYDKKRNRSKKSSERKFQFSTKKSDENSTSKRTSKKEQSNREKQKEHISDSKKDVLDTSQKTPITTETFSKTPTPSHIVDFEVFSKNDKQYQQRTTFQKKRSVFSKFKIPIIACVLIFGLAFVLSLPDNSEEKISVDEPNYPEKSSYTEKPNYKKKSYNAKQRDSLWEVTKVERFKRVIKPDISRVIIGNNVKLKEKRKRNSTYIKQIIPNVAVHIPKELPIFDTKTIPNVSILAKDAEHYFFYSIEKIEKGKLMGTQWRDMRESFMDESLDDYFYFANSESYDRRRIIEIDFSIIADGVIFYGAATLIEHKGRYHFFHFMEARSFMQKPNYKEVREKLYTYLKMELPEK